MKIRAVIFDWDEVIVKSDAFFEYSSREVMRRRGFRFDHDLYVRHFLGRTLKDAIGSYLREMKQPPELLDELVAEKKSFDVHYKSWIKPYGDALDLIARLQGRFPLAVASGTRRNLIDIGFKKFGLVHVFESIITAEKYSKGKPNPDPFLAAQDELNRYHGMKFSSEEIMVIEDAPLGIMAAKAAGMFCVAVTHSHIASELGQADLILDDLRNLGLDDWGRIR